MAYASSKFTTIFFSIQILAWSWSEFPPAFRLGQSVAGTGIMLSVKVERVLREDEKNLHTWDLKPHGSSKDAAI
jgi:hypothetical protein